MKETKTVVANILKNPNFPSVNGATGRRSPFRVESGVPWMWIVAEDLDESFARELEQLVCDSIVVWSPQEIHERPGLPLRQLTSVVMDRYAPRGPVSGQVRGPWAQSNAQRWKMPKGRQG